MSFLGSLAIPCIICFGVAVILYHKQALAVECLSLVILETLKRYGRAVIHTGDKRRAGHIELYKV